MTLIFFERKDMILDKLPDILNMVIRRIENFLRAFGKKFRLQKMAFLKHSPVLHQPDSESEFFKIQTFVRFLPYNLLDVSCDSDFF